VKAPERMRPVATDDSVITRIQPALAVITPRVLVVDDDAIMTARLGELVSAAGYQVATAASGEQALLELQREFAPIVILDRRMPGMDGLELCRTIRDGTHYPGYVYIILCTAQDSEEEILAGLNAGADDYLSKRASGAQLIARLACARRILTLEQSLKAVIEERRRMAMTDVLTGAHNRRYFMNHLRRELKFTRQLGADLSLVVFDIDHFKHINDSHGHAGGDAVLVEFVRRAQECLPREFDWCARLGGEEFAVVLPQTDIPAGVVVAEKIRHAFAARPITAGAARIECTVSVGITGLSAFADREAVTVEQLLGRADSCLYTSKNSGRDQVTVDVMPLKVPR
jgi:two-component system, cell cycle response regulator